MGWVSPLRVVPRQVSATRSIHEDAIAACPGSAAILTGAEGTFGISETQYINNMRCGWKIHVETGKKVQLTFLMFAVQFSNNCSSDYVKVYDGEDDSATLLGTFCGTTLPSDIISSSNYLFVSFTSESTGTGDGFSIKYTATVGSCVAHCKKCSNSTVCSQCDVGYALNFENTCEACSSTLENCNTCEFETFICALCSPSYQWDSFANECTGSGEMSILSHGGFWLNMNLMTGSLIAYLVSGPVM